MSRLPPERIDLGDLVLRRERVGDAAMIVPVLQADLDHLRPWMPWATEDNATVQAQRARLVEVEQRWDAAEDHGFLVLDAAESVVLGVFGLHRRVGPDAIELGYWLSVGAEGRGYATRAAGALTDVALRLDDIDRVEIHCDVANVRSQKVPGRLGYRLDRIEPDEIGRAHV